MDDKRMEKKKVTLQDIADALNITRSAVSKALNDHPKMSKKTKEAVNNMAKELSYKPNQLAAALRKGKSKLIGVIVPAANITFFSSVIRGLEESVNNAGYSVILTQSHDSEEKEKEIIDTLIETRVDGVVAALGLNTKDYSHFAKLKEERIPLVFFDRIIKNFGVSTVQIDDFKGAYDAVAHLIENGCKRIAHLGGLQHLVLYRNRLEGYKAALKDHGIEYHSELVQLSDLHHEDGRIATQRMLELDNAPDGIFCSSDYAAVGALQVARENGKDVPNDIKIVGFSNEPFTSFLDPDISSVDQSSVIMGHKSGELILSNVMSSSSEIKEQNVVLKPTLMIRKSSKIFL
ncbi:LacI family transcriptional regulator [Halosquirtibacter xylanolyticus]|uniref:LacI family DNA-binding transcriptional regulator n=1 Tax=Halosquirtibacter xylanolyticus TaxID=3374599 RepID=UPI003749B047|nr:LacI family transcriptional regulator [Prolixibacteraceae bacterium]